MLSAWAALQEEKLRAELNSLREQYGQQRSSTRIVGKGRESYSPHLPMAIDVGEKLADIRTRRLALESSLASFAGKTPSDVASATRFIASVTNLEGVDKREVTEIQEELADAELKAREVARSLGSEHPSRRAAEEQLNWMQQRFVEKSQQIATTLQEDLRLLSQSEARLRGEYQRELNSAQAADGQLLNDEILLAEIQRLTEAYSEASQQLARLQLADQEISGGRSLFRVESLDGARPHEARVWPQPRSVLGLCAVLGLLSGFLAAVYLDHLSRHGKPFGSI